MGFWIFMLIMNFLIPLTMIFIGRYFLRSAPKEINDFFGYRTTMSMKNRDTWEFAHRYIGRIWYNCGLVLLPLSIVPMFFAIGKSDNTIGMIGGIVCVIQTIPLIGSIVPTEKALKKHFDKNGMKR